MRTPHPSVQSTDTFPHGWGKASTAIFGEVDIVEEYRDERTARRAGYRYDAHAYERSWNGRKLVPDYKVLARWDTDRFEFCIIREDLPGKS